MIRNRSELTTTDGRETALACVEAGVRAAHPRSVVRETVTRSGDALSVLDAEYDLTEYDEVVVVGGGNAAGHVAAALEDVLGDRLDRGAVVTDDPSSTERVEVLPGDHPVPSERGVEGARAVLDVAESATADTLVLAVITGGGSALLPAPAGDVTLADLQATTDELLACGADIHEINAVRKHLSALKGGQLARAAAPATVVGLLLSDVNGDDRSVIGSGPTAPDESTFADAVSVLEAYDVTVPERVAVRLRRGADGDAEAVDGSDAPAATAGDASVVETPTRDDPVFDRVTNHVLANGFTALDAAREAAAERGYETMLLSSSVRGEAREAAKTHVAVAEEVLATGNPLSAPAVVLSGGETTVTVSGDGEGGPNQEFAASAAVELDADGVTLAAVDTDGIDGATDAAGAVVDADTVEAGGADAARAALAENDVTPFLAERDALIRTGATGTNVNDLRVLVVESED
ncbi:glycerate kinase type-2 family protein [Halobacterium hubeiense]|uniref:glycerate kinase type-2 family protein n=1 Tax=Halobacterium hubeiense TaxID=1407499 RepID=UPI003C714280